MQEAFTEEIDFFFSPTWQQHQQQGNASQHNGDEAN